MADVTCPICGSDDIPKRATGPRATYCSKRCRNRASYLAQRASGKRGSRRDKSPKTCPHCSASFIPEKSARQIYCSKRCSGAVHRNSRTSECSEVDCSKPVRARSLCANHYKQARRRAGETSWRDDLGDPEARRRRLRAKTQRRRALLSDPDAEMIDRDAVGDRDAWRCGLCDRRVHRELAWPNPMSASLDHIVPLSRGGKHVLANVQISHLSCNVAKGNRGGGEQLFLVG